MPIPSFTDTLGGALGPGITIIRDGDVFDDREADALDIEKMNKELEETAKKDDIVFLHEEDPREDIPFQVFLKSRGEKQ